MQEKYLYDYAVIRVLPKIEREEFINVGVIVVSKQARFIGMLYEVNKQRLNAFSDEVDLQLIESNLEALQKICTGAPDGGPIAKLDILERFRWITAIKSSCIQTSRPHSGFSSDLEKTVTTLFGELVI